MTHQRQMVLVSLLSFFAITLWYCVPALPEYPRSLSAAAFSALANTDLTTWQPLINFSYNAYHPWRIDTLGFGYLISESLSAQLHFSFLLLFLFLFLGSSFLFYALMRDKSVFKASFTSLVFCILIVLLYGFDIVIIGCLAWVPWLLLVPLSFCTTSIDKRLLLIISLLIGLRLAQSANQVSLYLVLFAILISHLLFKELMEKHDSDLKFFLYASFALLLAAPLFVAFAIPEPVFPAYPYLAQVVPEDGVLGIAAPAINAYAPVELINRSYLRETFGIFSIVLFILTLLTKRLATKTALKRESLLFNTALILIGLGVLDTILPEAYSHIAPLASAARLFPNLYFIALTPIVLALGFFFLLAALQVKSQILTTMAIALVVALVPYNQSLSTYTISKQLGALLKEDRLRAYHDFRSFAKEDKVNQETLNTAQQLLLSPSYYVINHFGFYTVRNHSNLSKARLLKLKDTKLNLSSSHNNDEEHLLALLDNSKQTRWSTHKGKQEGNEWLHLYFEKPLDLEMLQLDTGDYQTDYPRALKLSYHTSCTEPKKPIQREEYAALVAYPAWLGSLAYTKDDYPYFSEREKVRLIFPEKTTVQCLLIEQTGQSEHYDWSIAKLRF